MKNLKTIFTAVMAILLLTILNGQASAQTVLFGPVVSNSASKISLANNANLPKHVKRSNVLSLKNPQALKESSLILNLFSNKNFKVNRDSSGSGYLSDSGHSIDNWLGKIEGDSLSNVIIFSKDNWVSGRISRPGELYTFEGDLNGTATILDIDESKLPREIEVVEIR